MPASRGRSAHVEHEQPSAVIEGRVSECERAEARCDQRRIERLAFLNERHVPDSRRHHEVERATAMTYRLLQGVLAEGRRESLRVRWQARLAKRLDDPLELGLRGEPELNCDRRTESQIYGDGHPMTDPEPVCCLERRAEGMPEIDPARIGLVLVEVRLELRHHRLDRTRHDLAAAAALEPALDQRARIVGHEIEEACVADERDLHDLRQTVADQGLGQCLEHARVDENRTWRAEDAEEAFLAPDSSRRPSHRPRRRPGRPGWSECGDGRCHGESSSRRR